MLYESILAGSKITMCNDGFVDTFRKAQAAPAEMNLRETRTKISQRWRNTSSLELAQNACRIIYRVCMKAKNHVKGRTLQKLLQGPELSDEQGELMTLLSLLLGSNTHVKVCSRPESGTVPGTAQASTVLGVFHLDSSLASQVLKSNEHPEGPS